MSSPALTAYHDQLHRRMTEAIRRHGSWLSYVSNDGSCACCSTPGIARKPRSKSAQAKDPAFCYTTGLFGIGHPELLVYVLDMETSSGLLNLLVHQIRAHVQDLTPGETLSLDTLGLSVLVEEVPNPEQIVYAANDYYGLELGSSVPVLQLTWADPKGNYPWQPACAAPAKWQPRPGRHRA